MAVKRRARVCRSSGALEKLTELQSRTIEGLDSWAHFRRDRAYVGWGQGCIARTLSLGPTKVHL